MTKSIIEGKATKFSFKIIDLTRQLFKANEFILSKQILRSGTSIGANINEALASYTKKDFLFKMNIAYKEGKETLYWLKVINHQYNVPKKLFSNIKEINRMLAAIILNVKKQLNMLNQ